MTTRVAIIGGGYAGMAAAVELARAGVQLTVFEASPSLGGRTTKSADDAQELGSGRHLLFGSCSETLGLLRFLGIKPGNFHISPFQLLVPGRLNLRTLSLPAPLLLYAAFLLADGLNWSDKVAALKLPAKLRKRRRLREPDCTLAELLVETRQTPRLKELVWNPLCLELLKISAERASAQAFAHVFLDMFDTSTNSSETLIPHAPPADLLPVPAAIYVSRQGNPVRTATPIERIRLNQGQFELDGDDDRHSRFSHVILATAPRQALALLGGFDELTLLREQLQKLEYLSIATVHLGYEEEIRLPAPVIHPAGSPVSRLIDLGQTGSEAGTIVALIPARTLGIDRSHDELALLAHQAMEKLNPRLAPPRRSQVFIEEQATLAYVPGVMCPRTITPLRNLFLAGDYVETSCVNGLESAVRSGRMAARHVLRTQEETLQ